MSFCEHCQGQRFDRAQVLRTLRQIRRDLGGKHHGQTVDEVLATALRAVASLEIPHLEVEETGTEVVH